MIIREKISTSLSFLFSRLLPGKIQTMKILSLKKYPLSTIINEAVKTLTAGGLIIYPTETCYGLGADATNSAAIDKLLRYKGQRKGKPISVAVNSQQLAEKYVKINSAAQNIFRHLLPGPITVVCEGKQRVDPRLESERGTLGIRFPNHPLALKIIEKFQKPITATSANISGEKTPYCVNDILTTLSPKKKELLGMVIDAGKLPLHPPSTVVDTTLNEPTLLRRGEIDFDKLGAKSIITNSPQETQQFAQQLLKKNFSFLSHQTLLFALQGELGAGKTQFAKGLGQGLKISQPITSPTFIIVKEYPYKLEKINGIFYHIDAWRVANTASELEFIREYLRPGNIVALEWVQKGRKTLEQLTQNNKVKIIWVEITHLGGTKRRIRFTT